MRRRLIAAGLVATAIVLAAPAALAQGRDFGRTTIRVPEATTDGNWLGTWVFESRLRKIALWLRDGADGPELRLTQLMMTNAETFSTDWGGSASYTFPGTEGEVRIVIEEGDADRAVGSWFWRSVGPDMTVVENGRFTLFRAENGRYAVMRFDEFTLERSSGEEVKRTTPPRVWSFRKASRHIADWDELAF